MIALWFMSACLAVVGLTAVVCYLCFAGDDLEEGEYWL